jgi:ParB family chromosome partitioning protein
MTEETHTIPVDQLYLHPYNPRQTHTEADTEAMAQSIEVCGVMQNLLGYADPERGGEIGIVAGGRRLRALQLLATRDGGDPIEVPVRVTDDPLTAHAWSGAENASHLPPHPAEEIRAYRAMGEQGNTPCMIARAFAVTEAHVKRRLKLATLPEEALTALHDNQITLDAATALTLAQDDATVINLLPQIAGKDVSANQIRQALTPDTIPSTDRRATFVGLDTYRAEGGRYTEDLFTGTAYLEDEALLDRLFALKLDAKADEVKSDEGWQNVVPLKSAWIDYQTTDKFTRIWPEPVELPEADAEELEALSEIGTDGLSDEGIARRQELLDRERGDYTDALRETGTVFIYVTNAGVLTIDRAYAPRGQKTGTGNSASKSGGGEKPRMPQNCLDDLQRVQLLAQQTALVGKSELLLDILGWQIETGTRSYARPLGVDFSFPTLAPEKDSHTHIDARLSSVGEVDYSEQFSIDALQAFQAKGKKHRNGLIAAALARSVAPATMNGSARILAELAAPEIRKIWTPDAENYFGRIRADLLDHIWAEMLDLDDDDDRRADFARLKRKEKATELEALFTDASVQEAHGLSRDQVARIDAWLPEEMMT